MGPGSFGPGGIGPGGSVGPGGAVPGGIQGSGVQGAVSGSPGQATGGNAAVAPPGPVDEAMRVLQEQAARLGRLAEFGRQGVELSRFSDLGVSVVFAPTFQELASDFQRAAVYQVLAGHLARSPRIMRAGGFQAGFKQKILFQPDVIGMGVAEYIEGIKIVQ